MSAPSYFMRACRNLLGTRSSRISPNAAKSLRACAALASALFPSNADHGTAGLLQQDGHRRLRWPRRCRAASTQREAQ